MRRCVHAFLGRVGYDEATDLQNGCARALKTGLGEERLLLLEHDPVITLGRNARREDVLIAEETLRAQGVAVAVTDPPAPGGKGDAKPRAVVFGSDSVSSTTSTAKSSNLSSRS